jgi:predicted unusual protein kinase regulating ubiquinone biosynthesis (AarF/ABC1/UbiB family)
MPDIATSAVENDKPGVIADIPRRQFVKVGATTSLPQMRFVSFNVSHLRSLRHLFTWFRLLLYFFINTFMDALKGQDTPHRRALRLRRAFEGNGGSFIKLGLHLSMRVDFIPWTYSNELARMTDRMEPFPVEQAIATVERSTGKPLSATFSSFDPDPIISSSVACIYQAILNTGEKVIVKVRRPGIGERFMADLEAFDWLLEIAEFLTIFRPGLTQTMRGEFRSLLLEELDFVQEARRQDAFRRAAAASRQKFFSAPQIHLHLSGEEVVINEFASGMWLWELLAALENKNETVLAQARAMQIDPELVAKRLLWVNYWAREENLFFHADPNPDNIIIGHNSTLYFINFATTGTLSRTKRQAVRQNLHYTAQRDPQSMARSTLILMEPLPPIDMIEVTQQLETYNWQLLYALESAPDSLSWQERTSAVQWIGMIEIVRKHGILLDIQVLRMLRATMQIEGLAVRLDHQINFVKEYEEFDQYKAEEARRRVTDAITDQFTDGNNEQLVIRLDRIAHTVEGLFFRTVHMFSLPSVNFSALMSKWSFAAYISVRFFGQAIAMTLITALVVIINLYGTKQPMDVAPILQAIILNPIYQIVLLTLIFVNGRTILFRMDDKEVQRQDGNRNR